MQNSLWKRIIILVLIGVALLVPMSMIMGLISERQNAQRGVIQEIAHSSTGEQSVTGPVLIASYTCTVTDTYVWKNLSGKDVERKEKRVVTEHVKLLPDKLEIVGQLDTFTKRRGIYTARLYKTPLEFKGRFLLPQQPCLDAKSEFSAWGKAVMTVGVSDPRGIKNSPQLTIAESNILLQPGADTPGFATGLQATFQIGDSTAASGLAFRFMIELQGMERLWIVPTGNVTEVNLDSNWAHPSFYGRYLPEPKTEGETSAFPAKWRTSHFSTNIAKAYMDCVGAQEKCVTFQQNGFGVSLIQPVDVYQQLERSVKYAILFIGLTLIAFFFYEIFKRFAIHPIQYLLVGGALAMFYLLLTSLSEHIDFALAYVIAAGSCVGLIAFYVSYVLKSWRHGLSFGGTLGALYGALYVLLRSEDHALILGTLLLFGVLAAIMIGTRRVDWYALAGGRVSGGV